MKNGYAKGCNIIKKALENKDMPENNLIPESIDYDGCPALKETIKVDKEYMKKWFDFIKSSKSKKRN